MYLNFNNLICAFRQYLSLDAPRTLRISTDLMNSTDLIPTPRTLLTPRTFEPKSGVFSEKYVIFQFFGTKSAPRTFELHGPLVVKKQENLLILRLHGPLSAPRTFAPRTFDPLKGPWSIYQSPRTFEGDCH